MTIELSPRDRDASLNQALTLGLCRLSALLMFGLGLFCWLRLIGVEEGPLWRFDLMPFGWRIVLPALAVLYPIAATGLWMAVSWGPVVWVIVAAVEAAALLWLTPPLDPRGFVFGAHLFGLLCLVLLKAIARFEARRRP